jgi:hypothetical protein
MGSEDTIPEVIDWREGTRIYTDRADLRGSENSGALFGGEEGAECGICSDS